MNNIQSSHDAPAFNSFTFLALMGLFFVYGLILTNNLVATGGMGALYVLMLIQLLPFIVCLTTGSYNFLAFIMVVNFVSYSCAKFNQYLNSDMGMNLTRDTLIAIEALTICTVLTILAYYISRCFISVKSFRVSYKSFDMSVRQVVLTCLVMAFLYMLTLYLPNSVAVILKILVGFTVILVLCSKVRSSPAIEFIVKAAIVFYAFYAFIENGSQEQIGYLIGTLFMLACLQKSYKNIPLVAILMLAIISIQTVKAPYRNLMNDFAPNMGFFEKTDVLFGLLQDRFQKSGSLNGDIELAEEHADLEHLNIEEVLADDTTELLSSGFARAGDDSLERVLAWTPKKIPFWNGKSYTNIPYMLIPRFIWPDKPSWSQWNEFGRVYGFLASNDFETSVGVSYLGEAYMNFGYTGMYIFAILFGAFICMVEKLSYQILKGPYCFPFICFLFPLINTASNLGPILNSVFLTIISLHLFKKYLGSLAFQDPYAVAK